MDQQQVSIADPSLDALGAATVIPDSSLDAKPEEKPKQTAPKAKPKNSFLDDAWEFLNKPLTTLPPGELERHPIVAPLVQGLITPLNAATEAVGGLASATTEIAPALSKAAKIALRLGATGQAAQGATQILDAKDINDFTLGAVNLGLGAFGLGHKVGPSVPDVSKINFNEQRPFSLNSEANKPLFTSKEQKLLSPHTGRDINIPSNDEYQPSSINSDIEIPDTLGRRTSFISDVNPDIEVGPWVGPNQTVDFPRKELPPASSPRFLAGKRGIYDLQNPPPPVDISDPIRRGMDSDIQSNPKSAISARIDLTKPDPFYHADELLMGDNNGNVDTDNAVNARTQEFTKLMSRLSPEMQKAIRPAVEAAQGLPIIRDESLDFKSGEPTYSHNGEVISPDEIDNLTSPPKAIEPEVQAQIDKVLPKVGDGNAEITATVKGSDGKVYQHTFSGNAEEIAKGPVDTQEVPANTPIGTKVTTWNSDTGITKDDLPGKRTSGLVVPKAFESGEVGRADSVNKFFQAIRESIPTRIAQEESYSKERGIRALKSETAFNAAGGGQKGYFSALNKLKGPLEKVPFEPIKLGQSDVDNLMNTVFSSDDLQHYEKINAASGLSKILGYNKEGNVVPTKGEINLLARVFGPDKVQDLHYLFGGLGSISTKWKDVVDAVSVPKSFLTAMHLSAPFRQGLGMAHTKAFWNAIPEMVKSFGSEKTYNALDAANKQGILDAARKLNISGEDHMELAKKMGLAITHLGGALTEREDAIMSEKLQNAPYIGRFFKASNRTYSGFLNKLRIDNFNSLLDDASAAGLKPETNKVLTDSLASYINNATGRGSLGSLEKIAPELNAVLFSPRMIASRINMLNPTNFVNPNIPNFVKMQYFKSLIGMAGISSTIVGLGALAGGTVENDPRSADFGKIKFGNTRVDPYGGFQQYIVAAERLLQGQSKSSVSNKVSNLVSPKFGGSTRASVIGDFTRNKLSPIPGFIWDWLHAKGPDGKKFQAGPEVVNQFVPIIANTIFQLAKSDPNLLPLAIPAALGIGMDSYNAPTIGDTIIR